MQIVGTGNETYILLSGITVSEGIALSDDVQLQPADTSHLDFKTTLAACTNPDDIAVAAAFIPRISAQLQIKAPIPKDLATSAWNSSWDGIAAQRIVSHRNRIQSPERCGSQFHLGRKQTACD